MGIRKSISPVILDTDIGTDIDDTWALAMLLRCPELDPLLVVTASGDTTYRAHLAGAILSVGGRADVPIGIGPATTLGSFLPTTPQAGLADSYRLEDHPGGVRNDGVEALVECIMESREPVTLIAIGPLTNVAAALTSEPRIVDNARLVAMMGSVQTGVLGTPPGPEYNVQLDPSAAREVLAGDWEVTITPVDSCGAVILEGDRYQQLRREDDPLLKTVIDTYGEWEERAVALGCFDSVGYSVGMSGWRSTILFDTVAIYLAYSTALVRMETLPISIGEDGSTKVVADAPKVKVAVKCKLQSFLDQLVHRLLGHAVA